MGLTWSNWSGRVTCAPARIAAPSTEDDLRDEVRRADREGLTVRVAGTGHSFTPLCATDGLLLSLDALQGLVAADRAAMTATLWGGTKIHAIGDALLACGMGMENQGDIDRQALAGALSTGTHGTGRGIGSLSTQVVGMRLILPDGGVLDCSPARDAGVWRAARVALGACGVLSQITLRALPAYRLYERTWVEPFEQCVGAMPRYIRENRHFEFFWSPREDACAIKTLNPTTAERVESTAPVALLEGRLGRYVGPERIDWSYRIFPSERSTKFNEMEFSVPEARGPDCLRELRALMQTKYPGVAWPIEYRTLAADDIPLSTAFERESIAISIHEAADLPCEPFFRDAEAIFRSYQGRPHWGKLHWHTAGDLRALYPRWDDFHIVRRRLDPRGRFLNFYLRTLFGEDGP